MKKNKIMITIILIATMSILMCGMVFGFTYKKTFLSNAVILSGNRTTSASYFVPSKDDDEGDNTHDIVENQPMHPYYSSINSAGRFEVGVYTISGTSETKFDSKFKTGYKKTTSGFYTCLVDYAGEQKNYPFMAGHEGLVMNLDYLQVRYD